MVAVAYVRAAGVYGDYQAGAALSDFAGQRETEFPAVFEILVGESQEDDFGYSQDFGGVELLALSGFGEVGGQDGGVGRPLVAVGADYEDDFPALSRPLGDGAAGAAFGVVGMGVTTSTVSGASVMFCSWLLC